MFKVSIGIPAYNEEANIGQLLKSLLKQKLKRVEIEEIIVVASGCTDGTVEIVEKLSQKDKRIKLLKQKRRLGKTSADNLFLKKAKARILVLVGADTLLKNDCLENLIVPFKNPKVGVTAARILPLNNSKSLPGYFSYLWWHLFDKIAVDFFRAGEALAFRKVVKRIPRKIGSDEVFLTDAILAKGYKAKYARKAVVYNMGPENIKDIILMRRKHNCLTFQIMDWGLKAYYPKTMDNLYVFRLFLEEVNWLSPKETSLAILTAFLEMSSRLLAYYDYNLRKRNYLVWPRGESTKRLFGLKERKRKV